MSTYEIVSECTTEGTSWKGERHSAYAADWSSVTAPEGYVLNDKLYDPSSNPKGYKVEWLGMNGSENSYALTWDNLTEIIPGLTYPRTIRVRAYARSPKGHGGGRGWSKVKISGEFIKYK